MALRNYFGKLLENTATGLNAYGISTPNLNLSERVSGTYNPNPQMNSWSRPTTSSESVPYDQPAYDPNGGITPFNTAPGSFEDGEDGSGSGGTDPLPPQYEEFGGRMYQLDNPAQAQAYYDAVNAENFGVANQNYNRTRENINSSRTNLNRNTTGSLEELKRQREALRSEKENYFVEMEKQGKDFVTGKSLGDTNRQNYFSNLGSNAFQSSQATSQDFADNKFAEGLAEQQKSKLDAEGQFSGRSDAYGRKESDINFQAAQDETGLANNERDALFERDNYIASNKAKVATGLAQVGQEYGLKDYSSKFKMDPYSNVNANKADLSGVSKFTNFQAGGGVEEAGATGNKFSSLAGKNVKPLDNYFGYEPDEKTRSRISNYFAGSAA